MIDSSSDMKWIRSQYQVALADSDQQGQLHWLIQLIPLVIADGSPLAAARLVDEAFVLVRTCPDLARTDRVRLGMQCVRLWWRSGRKARDGKDASHYWFFRT